MCWPAAGESRARGAGGQGRRQEGVPTSEQAEAERAGATRTGEAHRLSLSFPRSPPVSPGLPQSPRQKAAVFFGAEGESAKEFGPDTWLRGDKEFLSVS